MMHMNKAISDRSEYPAKVEIAHGTGCPKYFDAIIPCLRVSLEPAYI
jgi:hypothetical protein